MAASADNTVGVKLGEHTVEVPKGGYYDRYRMEADLDEVEQDPGVPSVDFFRKLPKRVVESKIGPTATPNYYYAMSMAQIGMLAPIGAVRERLPEGLVPLQPAPGLGLIALVFYSYDVCDIDPYNEATVAIACRPPRHGGPSQIDFAQSMLSGTTYGYSLALPVSTEIAYVRGFHGYALPKWRTDIEISADREAFSGRVANDSGETDIAVRLPIPRQTTRSLGRIVKTTIALSQLDGAWHETRSLFHALASGTSYLPRGVEITSGNGRVSQELAALKPIRPLTLDVMTSAQLALNMPVPVSISRP